MRKGIFTAENFGALMISYSEIGGHVSTPFLDTYPESVECRSARWGSSNWSAVELLMRVVADEETAEYG